MTAYCNFCQPPKRFKDSESRDSHLKRDHTQLTRENVEYLLEKGTPVENIARHFNIEIEEVKGMVAQQKLEVV